MERTRDGLQLSGTFSIGGYESTKGRGVRFEIVDDLSGCTILRATTTHEALGQALCGSSIQPCRIEFFKNAPIGMKAENKTEFVPCPKFLPTPAEAKSALKSFEVDGWHARSGDLGNHHCYANINGVPGFRVVFFRHVPVEENNETTTVR